MLGRVKRLGLAVGVGIALIALLGFGCRESPRTAAGVPGSSAVASAAQPAPARAVSAEAPGRPPLPAFTGVTLSGERFEARSLLGRRALLFLFNPEATEAGPVADAVARVARLAERENFRVIGIALVAGREAAARFAEQHGFGFPILDDSDGTIARRLGLRARVGLLGVDAEGNLAFAFGAPASSGEKLGEIVEARLREELRLPAAKPELGSAGGRRVRAPDFEAERLDGGKLHLASYRGRPVVLIFFLHTCPHCHHALRFLRDELARLPADKRPVLIGVSVANRPYSVREALREAGLDFFPVVFDPDGSIRERYGVIAGVPDTFLINAQGEVVARVRGWRDERDPPLMRMRLAKLAGLEPPILLDAKGYSGTEACTICHEPETHTWQLTRHANAFDSLVRRGKDRDPECVRCHVVGFGEPGGYSLAKPARYLENVGCEACHGRGGPHLSPDFVQDDDYEPACRRCHDPKHSLGFEYAKFLPRVSHEATAALAGLSPEERARRLAALDRRLELVGGHRRYVGSEACKSCHESEFTTWTRSPHAHAFESLVAKKAADRPQCLRCHTTAMGRPGGFDPKQDGAQQRDLARVGCESCHGPGSEHATPEGSKRPGTIVSLGDKCDSCVVLQLCGSCHDEKNDPGFEYAVERKIEAQRHGTIRPRASRASAATAAVEGGG